MKNQNGVFNVQRPVKACMQVDERKLMEIKIFFVQNLMTILNDLNSMFLVETSNFERNPIS